MHPTGIDMDDQGTLYVNEWYKIPGSEGSSSALGLLGTAKAGAGAGKDGNAKAGTKGANPLGTSGAAAGGAAGTKGATQVVSISNAGTNGATPAGTAGTKAGTKVGTVRGTNAGSSAGESGAGGVSGNTVVRESDIAYGYEPQYLHNVRLIETQTGLVRTIAGSYIRK